MAIYRISDDFYDHSYILIAIHCAAEDYRLAYFLNLQLQARFKKLPDIDFHQNNSAFSLYEWEDHKKGNIWNLISNISKTGNIEIKSKNTLFSGEMASTISYLIPERKQTDYFLKIDGETVHEDIITILHKTNKIPQIITTYSINPDQLKSKQNLII